MNQVVWNFQWLAVTLLSYTTEKNCSEVAINIIKSRIDRELKGKKVWINSLKYYQIVDWKKTDWWIL